MPRILAISGGVGGAKLALGLARILGPDELTFAVNTGDDFEHLGFYIAPDVDTLTYTLAEISNTETGWGRGDESWEFMAALEDLETGSSIVVRVDDRIRDATVVGIEPRRILLSENGVTRQIALSAAKARPVADPSLYRNSD